ncbi:hypothetical protein B0F90DRAFT_1107560 [Multifurca ochricompacta]|uniref:CAP-Gly domain-containing protein n=1 Tax=Multifurca ochricompacta TaxID=376703 RepID=A0AAD4M8H7_9AGAM|nr:hypothetical protein B0F90DRAFT_1107560 [Multifurca ochricompacta]
MQIQSTVRGEAVKLETHQLPLTKSTPRLTYTHSTMSTMSTTPGKIRQSAIPTPGKTSGLPTPGRLRSASVASQQSSLSSLPTQESDPMSRAFADAIKANDPALHRTGRISEPGNSSISPKAPLPFLPQSGRRSVTGRPSSAASSSSNAGATPARHTPATRTKTPSVRPPSRQSDTFIRSSSRTGRSFEVGDNVRIESLGFEGTLRYLGDIDGKAGQWAGVELGGGFAGKGKNDGSVDGKHYFVCPPKCGVFVASAKLSAPTVGVGAISRPSSVASSRGGRVTPSCSSGHITPSNFTRHTPYSNGRVTPASSTTRVLPEAVTPSARPRVKTTTTPFNGIKRSGSRTLESTSPTGQSSGRTLAAASPTRFNGPISPHTGSTFSNLGSPSLRTPKSSMAGRGSGIGVGFPSTTPTKNRTPLLTPKLRIPSAIAMPPPPSPASATSFGRAVSLNDYTSDSESYHDALNASDIQSNGKAIQDKIASLLSARKALPADISTTSPVTSALGELDGGTPLRDRVTELEAENQRLNILISGLQGEELEQSRRTNSMREDRDQALTRVAELETSVKSVERNLHDRDLKIEVLERSLSNTSADTEKARADGETRVRNLQSLLDDKDALLSSLKESLALKEGAETETHALIIAKDAEINLLEARVKKGYTELEEERKELGGQVDALRHAGQETIALYEERLSTAEAKRYEMEDLIGSLREQLRSQAQPPSPASAARHLSSATQIENEALREQVVHLQKKLTLIEDMLEEMRATAEKDETAVREKLRRYKEKEELLRQQVAECELEITRLVKSENNARARTEEVGEALRESTVALENARAEIEGLRAEIADLEGITSLSSTDSADKPSEPTQRLTAEHTRYTEEIARLKSQLAEATEALQDADNDRTSGQLQETIDQLLTKKANLENIQTDLRAKLAEEINVARDLRERLEHNQVELETMRKKAHRDAPVSDGLQQSGKLSPSSMRHDSIPSSVREEIAGLKHIIQELQKENANAAHQNKLLESENKLLLSETEQLRKSMEALEEDSMRSKLPHDEVNLQVDGSIPPGDAVSLQKALREMRARYEIDLEQLRKRLTEIEAKSARTVHDLNKEVGELESLIETKIYREDELEQEIEQLKEKLARNEKKSSKRANQISGLLGADSLDSLSIRIREP